MKQLNEIIRIWGQCIQYADDTQLYHFVPPNPKKAVDYLNQWLGAVMGCIRVNKLKLNLHKAEFCCSVLKSLLENLGYLHGMDLNTHGRHFLHWDLFFVLGVPIATVSRRVTMIWPQGLPGRISAMCFLQDLRLFRSFRWFRIWLLEPLQLLGKESINYVNIKTAALPSGPIWSAAFIQPLKLGECHTWMITFSNTILLGLWHLHQKTFSMCL